jgi:type IV pilus assembly protein PilA
MKQANRKKGFSLIELIVVIAVIAAIAAVIVPQFGNISGAAKNSADQRNVQLWNETYANAYAFVSGGVATGTTKVTDTMPTADIAAASNVAAFEVTYTLSDGTNMTFAAPAFTIAGNSTVAFVVGKGLSLTKK